MKSVSEKLSIKQGMRAIFVNASPSVMKAIDPPNLEPASRLSGDFDYIHFFSKSQEELDKKFDVLKRHLKPTGALWISWRKGRKEGSNLTLTKIIKIGYDHGLVESKTLSVDATWSALKFTFPKKGKVYNNSYGKLRS